MQQTSARMDTILWLAQRIRAMGLAVAIIVHIITMIIAMQGGLSTSEIADRLGGNLYWLVFYAVFVTAVSIHAPIGLRAVLLEITSLPASRIDLLTMLFGLFVFVLGIRTLYGLFQLGGAV